MRTTNYIKFLICLLFFTTSCSNDLLNLEPLDQGTADNFFTSEENATAALTGCYQPLLGRAYGAGRWFFTLDWITPNAFDINNATGASSIARGNNGPELPLVVERYEIAYQGIGRTNLFLANIDNVPMDDDLRERFRGEALFLRAFYYHNLIEFYGGVPLILDPPDNNSQGQLPRNSKQEVLQAIYADLDTAAALLPVEYPSSDTGRATRGAALTLKARAALYNEDWSLAVEAAQAVVDLGVYGLFPNYRNMFLLDNERHEEVIFEVTFQFPEITNNYHEAYLIGNVLRDLPDSYLMLDGEPASTSSLFDPANPYENRDPRLEQSLITIGSMYNGAVVTGEEAFAGLTGFSFKKYTYFLDDVPGMAPPQNQAEINAIIMRYAEVLLILAEAENELNGPTITAYNAINQVRNRPSVAMPNVTPGLSQDAFREVVRLERRIELAGEGLFYNDIRRWQTAEIVLNQNGLDSEGEVIEMRSFDPSRDYLWPIPDAEILLNPNLEQNPGY